MSTPQPGLPFTTVATPEQTLGKHGLTSADLAAICYAIARQYARTTGSQLDTRIDDLAQHLALKAIRRLPDYDPKRASIRTWLWNELQPACKDWHRRKAEGFGDRRYGHENRLVLTDHRTMEHEDPTGEYDFDKLANDDRQERWLRAAEVVGWSVEEWIVLTLDRAARDLLEAA